MRLTDVPASAWLVGGTWFWLWGFGYFAYRRYKTKQQLTPSDWCIAGLKGLICPALMVLFILPDILKGH